MKEYNERIPNDKLSDLIYDIIQANNYLIKVRDEIRDYLVYYENGLSSIQPLDYYDLLYIDINMQNNINNQRNLMKYIKSMVDANSLENKMGG